MAKVHVNQNLIFDASQIRGQSASPATTPTIRSSACSLCGGTGWRTELTGDGLFDFRQVRCECAEFIKDTRLTPEEQALTIDDLRNRADDDGKEVMAMRFLAKQLLQAGSGFFSLCGGCGSGKSMLLKATVADFARSGRDGRYYVASEIVSGIMPKDGEGGAGSYYGVSGDGLLALLRRIPVLAIDELDKVTWSQYVGEKMGAVIDHRYRHAERLVTLFGMNDAPEAWYCKPGVSVRYLESRLTDVRFNRRWPEQYAKQTPPCIQDGIAPGFFRVTLADVRGQRDF